MKVEGWLGRFLEDCMIRFHLIVFPPVAHLWIRRHHEQKHYAPFLSPIIFFQLLFPANSLAPPPPFSSSTCCQRRPTHITTSSTACCREELPPAASLYTVFLCTSDLQELRRAALVHRRTTFNLREFLASSFSSQQSERTHTGDFLTSFPATGDCSSSLRCCPSLPR